MEQYQQTGASAASRAINTQGEAPLPHRICRLAWTHQAVVTLSVCEGKARRQQPCECLPCVGRCWAERLP